MSEKVLELCGGGNCCPVLVVRDDGKLELRDGEQVILLDHEQAENLVHELRLLGYGG